MPTPKPPPTIRETIRHATHANQFARLSPEARRGLTLVQELQQAGALPSGLRNAIQAAHSVLPDARAAIQRHAFEEQSLAAASEAVAQDLEALVSQVGVEGARQYIVQRGGAQLLPGLEAMMAKRAESQQADAADAEFHERAEASARATVERWSGDLAKTPVGALLADPAFHAQASAWYGPRAAALEKAGLGLAKGESCAEWVIRLAHLAGPDGNQASESHRQPFGERLSSEEAVNRLAQLAGEKPEVIKNALGSISRTVTQHQVLDRLSQRDRGHAPKEIARPGAGSSVRSSVEAAVKTNGGLKERPVPVGNGLQAVIAAAAGHDIELFTNHAREEVQDMLRPAPPDTSLRATIESAVAGSETQTEEEPQ